MKRYSTGIYGAGFGRERNVVVTGINCGRVGSHHLHDHPGGGAPPDVKGTDLHILRWFAAPTCDHGRKRKNCSSQFVDMHIGRNSVVDACHFFTHCAPSALQGTNLLIRLGDRHSAQWFTQSRPGGRCIFTHKSHQRVERSKTLGPRAIAPKLELGGQLLEKCIRCRIRAGKQIEPCFKVVCRSHASKIAFQRALPPKTGHSRPGLRERNYEPGTKA